MATPTGSSEGLVFPHRFYNEANLELSSPGQLDANGRRFWLVVPVIPGGERWRPGMDPGYFRIVYTHGGMDTEYDVAYYIKESDTWDLAIRRDGTSEDAGSEHGDKEDAKKDDKDDKKDDAAKQDDHAEKTA